MDKIVITGMGAVTPIGIGVDTYWNNLIEGKSGIDIIKSFDASELAVQIAGEVKDFNPSDWLPKDVVRKTDAFMQYAYIAAEEALKQSGVEIEPQRTGIVMGTAMSGISTIAFTQEALTGAAHKKVGPRFIPKADVMLAVGAEAAHCPIFIYSLSNAKALSRNNDDPQKASRPFDESRDGFVIGEGGGALVLESEPHAIARGAKILGELLACGNTCDAYHVTAPHPEGRGAIACMNQALAEAGLKPEDIGYINAHGTSTPKGDEVEVHSVTEVFGENAPLVSSTKGATGHMMGAGGVTEVITCLKAIETGIVPPTINLENPIPDCKIDFVANEARKAQIDYAMSNAFGFGGQNSSVIVGRYK